MTTLIFMFLLVLYFLIGFVFTSIVYILNALWRPKLPAMLKLSRDSGNNKFELMGGMLCWPILLLIIVLELIAISWIKLLDKICLAIDNLKQEKGE